MIHFASAHDANFFNALNEWIVKNCLVIINLVEYFWRGFPSIILFLSIRFRFLLSLIERVSIDFFCSASYYTCSNVFSFESSLGFSFATRTTMIIWIIQKKKETLIDSDCFWDFFLSCQFESKLNWWLVHLFAADIETKTFDIRLFWELIMTKCLPSN